MHMTGLATQFIMGHGQIVFEGTPQELRADEAIRREWLEV